MILVMNRYRFEWKGLVKQTLSVITRALQSGTGLSQMKKQLKDTVNAPVGLNKTERLNIYRNAYEVYRACYRSNDWRTTLGYRDNYNKILYAVRNAKATMQLRNKRIQTRLALADSSTVFFLCSTHDNCAEGHRDLQGKVYYDRLFRTKVFGFNYYRVLSYIKNHHLKSIQDVSGKPYWLGTRKYCKHFMIPVDTEAVLSSSSSKLVQMYHAKTYGDSVFDTGHYYRFRAEVYSELDSIEPCKQFKIKARN